MANTNTTESRDLEGARQFVRHAQGRLDRAHGLSDDVQRQLQNRLNEVRHLIEDGEAEAAHAKIDELSPWLDKQLEGKEKTVLREYAESIGLAILFALILRGFVLEAFKIPTGSMIPTLLVGDHLFVNKFIYGIRVPFTETYLTRFEQPDRGEVIVFKFPGAEARQYLAKQPASRRECIDTASLVEEKDFIKRIVGIEGDTVELRDNQLIINGEPVERTFVSKESTGNYLFPHQVSEVEELNGHEYTIQYSGKHENFGPIKVKKDHVFVMGDNRDNSSDGRCWGQVPVENIKGRAMIIWLSLGPDSIRWDRLGQVIH
ncbi:signal peptidase I [Persicimonas caeni]|uniref:signal peptidase I n=1 Tax=Persicimonas caeni TaxID=2292766 RepID=UPI001C9A3C1A|nr:signal peptidase I [Persicimonas caeni]